LKRRNPEALLRKVMRVAGRSTVDRWSFGRATPSDRRSTAERRQEIIASYLKVLDCLKSPIRSESELPFSREAIQRAIVEELVTNPGTDFRGHLEVAYAEVESFVPVEE
jgi:hypothetical protein